MNPTENSESLIKLEMKKGKKELSLERVRLALERLQLGWLRTAITFIALGFTSYKYYYARLEAGKEPLITFFNGHQIGLFMILVGFLGLSQATWQHRKNWAKLSKYYPGISYSVALMQSYLILAFAVCLLLVVIFEL